MLGSPVPNITLKALTFGLEGWDAVGGLGET